MSNTETSILDDPVWAALSSERQDELLVKYRDVNVGHEWWDFTYDCFKERCADLGITVYADDISFSGFWSQGDGASFEGYINDWSKILPAIKLENLLAAATENDWSFKILRRGNYYSHSNTMNGELNADLPVNPFDEEDEPLQYDAWNIANPIGEYELNDLETTLTDFCRGLADELYHDLEEEYDYLTSDETIVEYILEHADDDELKPNTDDDEEETEDATDHTNQLVLFP